MRVLGGGDGVGTPAPIGMRLFASLPNTATRRPLTPDGPPPDSHPCPPDVGRSVLFCTLPPIVPDAPGRHHLRLVPIVLYKSVRLGPALPAHVYKPPENSPNHQISALLLTLTGLDVRQE